VSSGSWSRMGRSLFWGNGEPGEQGLARPDEYDGKVHLSPTGRLVGLCIHNSRGERFYGVTTYTPFADEGRTKRRRKLGAGGLGEGIRHDAWKQ
jgi:hypothetical protein